VISKASARLHQGRGSRMANNHPAKKIALQKHAREAAQSASALIYSAILPNREEDTNSARKLPSPATGCRICSCFVTPY